MADSSVEIDLVLKGGLVVDPAAGREGRFDVAISGDRIAAVAPEIVVPDGAEEVDVSGKLVTPGWIDTHAHVYRHVTGAFGLEADLVGVRSGVTTLLDQGGPSCMTIGGFRHFIAEPAASRVLCFISAYLVGGLEGHLYPDLYGPYGVDVEHTLRAIEANRDLVKGIKGHAEVGGASRWGLDVIRLAKEISRRSKLPLYIHLGQLWPTADGDDTDGGIDADALVADVIALMEPGDVLAHPFTRHPGGFISEETGAVHPVVQAAVERGVLIDVGHGSHFSFDMARRVIDAGIWPFTLGADLHGYNVHQPDPGLSDDDRADNPFHGVAPFSLAIAMSELLALGVPLAEVVATVTANAARLLRLDEEIGTLGPGLVADLTVADLHTGRFPLRDNSGATVVAERYVQPLFCYRAGRRFEADSPLLPDLVQIAA
jgi:dihydroorotase